MNQQTAKKSVSRSPKIRIAFVSSAWHRDIIDRARDSAFEELGAAQDVRVAVEQFEVPGAFELPLHTMLLARSGRYDGIIACGFVVNGGIYRHEFVTSAVIDGLMRVQLDTAVPVFSAVLTPRDFHEHAEHQRFFSEHFVKKGREVAQACLQTLSGLRVLKAALK